MSAVTTKIVCTDKITVNPIGSTGGDAMVIAAARASTSGEAALDFTDSERVQEGKGLINYLMRNRHGTPFEHASMTFFVHAPAFVWWEHVRHRIGWSYNLESGRYKVLEPVFWVPKIDRKIRPSKDHKPSKPEFEADFSTATLAQHYLEDSYQESYSRYEKMIEAGIANEVARAALPFAIYYSGWATCNPRSLMAFLSLRTHELTASFPSRPQAEIEEVARLFEEFFAQGWPITYAAFCKNGRVAP